MDREWHHVLLPLLEQTGGAVRIVLHDKAIIEDVDGLSFYTSPHYGDLPKYVYGKEGVAGWKMIHFSSRRVER